MEEALQILYFQPILSSIQKVLLAHQGILLFLLLMFWEECIASVGNIPGSIRSWYWFSEYGVMLYNIWENRFCENSSKGRNFDATLFQIGKDIGDCLHKLIAKKGLILLEHLLGHAILMRMCLFSMALMVFL